MKSILSGVAAVLALLVPLPAAGGGGLQGDPRLQLQSRERLELARQRQALHERAMAMGDPSRSPYFRWRGGVGQSASRHDEHSWYLELINRG